MFYFISELLYKVLGRCYPSYVTISSEKANYTKADDLCTSKGPGVRLATSKQLHRSYKLGLHYFGGW